MIQQVLAVTTAITMMVHAIFGCCAHHEHSHAVELGVQQHVVTECEIHPVVHVGSHNHAEHHASIESSEEPESQGEHSHRVCGGVVCKYLVPAKCSVERTATEADGPFAGSVMLPLFDVVLTAHGVKDFREPLPDILCSGNQPARTQVWLL
jgi:hypothetical protein